MKTTKRTKIATALILIAAFAVPSAFSDTTEVRLEQRMRERVQRVSDTLVKYDTFKTSYESNQDRQGREEMLRKLAKRMRESAEELARSAEMLETQLLLDQAGTAEETELLDTKRNISELRREIRELQQKQDSSKATQNLAAVK